MNKKDVFKIVGLVLTVLGAIAGVGSSIASEKRQDIEIDEKVNDAVDKKFGEMSESEEEES